ncbi:hypothetical protein SERLA73DRAFT_76344 [Serpula lacrymans var. lacrymans S7.3]|uniref:Uncharacterized protein n=1 Tax=Serpula lacrymans var. lacrymans (strain S7.3) TaxID=936435 RepID=F8Q6Z2_SERL3|nr:hypothetical protein SERLA73DRAFT_76344 [Serpula lacrymans var. lacrymans S7.3]
MTLPDWARNGQLDWDEAHPPLRTVFTVENPGPFDGSGIDILLRIRESPARRVQGVNMLLCRNNHPRGRKWGATTGQNVRWQAVTSTV